MTNAFCLTRVNTPLPPVIPAVFRSGTLLNILVLIPFSLIPPLFIRAVNVDGRGIVLILLSCCQSTRGVSA